jgi:hypothetical protein
MLWTQRLWLRLQTLFRGGRAAHQLHEEVQFHIDQQISENIAAGMSPEDARHAAMRAFGNVPLIQEDARRTWGWTTS